MVIRFAAKQAARVVIFGTGISFPLKAAVAVGSVIIGAIAAVSYKIGKMKK